MCLRAVEINKEAFILCHNISAVKASGQGGIVFSIEYSLTLQFLNFQKKRRGEGGGVQNFICVYM